MRCSGELRSVAETAVMMGRCMCVHPAIAKIKGLTSISNVTIADEGFHGNPKTI